MPADHAPLPYSPTQIIAQTFGLDAALLFDDEAQGRIQLDGAVLHLQVYQKEAANVLLLLADLGPLARENRLALYQLLLAANSGWRELAGGALCTDETGERAWLRLRLDLNTLTAEVLDRWLTALVQAAEAWARRLAMPPAAANQPVPEPELPPALFGNHSYPMV